MRITREMKILLLFFIFITVQITLYLNIGIENDEAYYLYSGREILHGKLPYIDFASDVRLPGTHYFIAGIFAVFGESFTAVRLVLYLINFATALSVFFLVRMLWHEKAGFIAFIILLIGFSIPTFESYYMLSDQGAVLFSVLAVYSFFRFRNNKGLLLAGIFTGISTLFKTVGIVILAALFFLYFKKTICSKRKAKAFLEYSRSYTLLLLGFLVPISIALVNFVLNNSFNDMVYWLLTTTKYFERHLFVGELMFQLSSFAAIWLLVLFQMVIFIRKAINGSIADKELFVLLWALVSIYPLTHAQYGHWYLLLLPPVAAMAGVFFSENRNRFSLKKDKALFITFILALASSITVISISEYRLLGNLNGFGTELLKCQTSASAYVKNSTNPEEKILVTDYAPEIYFLSGRSPPIKSFHMQPPYRIETEDQIIAAVQQENVALIVQKGCGFTPKLCEYIAGHYSEADRICKYKMLRINS